MQPGRSGALEEGRKEWFEKLLALEVKVTHSGMTQKKVREELIIDKAFYKGHKN